MNLASFNVQSIDGEAGNGERAMLSEEETEGEYG